MMHDRILRIENEWKRVKGSLGKDASMSIPIPVIYAASFADAEHITGELGRFIYASKIVEKTNSSHEDYLFFSVEYSAPHDKNFYIIQEFYNHVRNAGGYYGSYHGIILVDVSEWRGHFKEKYFDIFLAYLADCRMGDLIPFFYADCSDSEEEKRLLEAVVSSYFSIIRVNVSAADLCKYAVSIFEDRNLRIDDGARIYLKDFFKEASNSALFHGTESVLHICESVVREYNSERNDQLIDEARLRVIIKDLGFWDKYYHKPTKMIGFR